MARIIKLLSAIGLVAIAILLHQFYVSYQLNADTYILKWGASPKYHEAFLKQVAHRLERQPSERRVRVISQAQADAQERAFIRDPANSCRLKTPPSSDQPSWARALYLNHAPNYICNKSWVDPSWATVEDPGVSFEQAMDNARKAVPESIYGMTPSLASAGKEPSRTATARSLWLGVILPISLLLASLGLLVSFLISIKLKTGKEENQSIPLSSTSEPAAAAVEPPKSSHTEERKTSRIPLVDVLKQRFGSDLPVSRGNATKDDPLIITETVDYVSIEYAVANFLMSGEEYKKESQKLLDLNGRKVDELVFATKTSDADDWEWTRRFYFDITDGFNRLGKY